jgi:molybdate transport system substrate-binding protein
VHGQRVTIRKQLDRDKSMKRILCAATVAGLAFSTIAARAADITILASNGVKAPVVELAPQFEKETGHKLNFTWGASNLLVKQAETGEPFDVIIVTPALIKSLIQEGKVVDGSAVDLARVGLGVAVKQGAPKPDISTVEAFKNTMLNAKAIAFTTAGQSGLHFMGVAEKLGIAEQVKAKSKTVPGGAAAEFVAKGEADIAVQLIPELASVPGVEVAGPFPAALQNYIVLTGGVGTNAKDKGGAQALIKYLTTPAAISVIKAKGMEPG